MCGLVVGERGHTRPPSRAPRAREEGFSHPLCPRSASIRGAGGGSRKRLGYFRGANARAKEPPGPPNVGGFHRARAARAPQQVVSHK